MKKLLTYTLLILLTSMGTATFAQAAGSVYVTTPCQSDNNCPSGSSCDMSSAQSSGGYGTCVSDTATSGAGGGGTGTPTAQPSAASSNTGTNLSYTPLEPLPGVDYKAVTASNGLGTIVNVIFTILITIGALIAVLMLTIGGFQYMLSGGPIEKTKGIKRVQSALWGIVLIAAIWLILHTINPALLSVNLAPCPQGVVGINCAITAQAPAASKTVASAAYDATTVNQATQTLVNGVNPADPSGSAQKLQDAQQTLDQQNALNIANCTQNGGTPLSGYTGQGSDPRLVCSDGVDAGTYKTCTPIASNQVTQNVGAAGLAYVCAQ